MLVIAHRGASGERPEHTLAAYELAIDHGADFIEPDLVATRDGVLVSRHENEISGTTDVSQRPEFAARLTTRMIDGEEMTGWFTEDFTLAELRTLRAKEAETGRTIGLYPEIKHPSYFASIGHDLAVMLVEQLHAAGYKGADAPVFIQSFEVEPLRRLNDMTDIRLVQLVSADGGPADIPGVTYRSMLDAQGLITIAAYADAIGADVRLILSEDGRPTSLVQSSQFSKLQVHAWTLRPENAFLPEMLRTPDGPGAAGCDDLLFSLLDRAGVDAVFADSPRRTVEWRAGARQCARALPIGPVIRRGGP